MVRATRLRLEISQEELAWRANLHRTYIADIERGARNLTLRSVVNLAKALEVTVAGLLGAAADPAGPAPTPGRRPAAAEEILLVEDNLADAALAERAFKRARIRNGLRIVRSGEEAWNCILGLGRFAKQGPFRPALILLDLNLPRMSGLDFLRRIRSDAQLRDLAVVVLTVSRSDQMIIECGRLGAANYIVKPVGVEGLVGVTPKLNLSLTFSATGSLAAKRGAQRQPRAGRPEGAAP